MSVSGTVCHLILYFPVKQGLSNQFAMASSQNKQCMYFEHFEAFLTSSADQCFFCFVFYLYLLLTIYTYKLLKILTKHPTSRLYLIIGLLHCRGKGSAIIFDDLHLQIIQSISTVLHCIGLFIISLAFVNKAQ